MRSISGNRAGRHEFKILKPGEPFLFKLHHPLNFIVGGGFFAHFSLLPTSIAWETFGEKNGAQSFSEMRRRIERYRHIQSSGEDYQIGCILLAQPFFFQEEEWISVPQDWSRNIVQGKSYDLSSGIGERLWEQVEIRLEAKTVCFRRREVLRKGSVTDRRPPSSPV